MLEKLLEDAIQDSPRGCNTLKQVKIIRMLSKSSRAGNEKHREELLHTLENLSEEDLVPMARAFSQFLNLANVAEQYQTISRSGDGTNHPSILKTALENLRSKANISKERMHKEIHALSLELVLTAHPTEINRRTLIHKLIEINNCLGKLDHNDLSKYERSQVMDRLRQLVSQAWHTDEIRKQRPTPIEEAKWGFEVVENSLWEGVPAFLRELTRQIKCNFDITLPIDFVPVRFSSWMGGDRDGNPNVTAAVTKRTMQLSRWKSAELFLKDINILISELSMSSCDAEIYKLCGGHNHIEPYRVILKKIRSQLTDTQNHITKCMEGECPTPADRLIIHSSQLWEPLYTIYQSLQKCGMGVIADGKLLDTLRRVKCFGVPLVSLDLRQESTRHTEVISEITRYLGLGDYSSWSEEEKQDFLVSELNSKRPLIPYDWSPSRDVAEVIETFRVAAKEPRGSISAYIISMAKKPSDVLAVNLLLKEAGVSIPIPVVPLFETLDDLNNANNIMEKLLDIEWYRNYIQGKQMVMIGYSDSAKDAGVLAANWAQYQAQEALIETFNRVGIDLTLFHGRGGTIGRGGAPAQDALLSQPPGSLVGGLRVTEQGEMIRFKYGLPAITIASLSLYTCAVLEANLLPPPEPKKEWGQIMDQLSADSCKTYRSYVRGNPNFVTYFRAATPELELKKLPLGSRPAKRGSTDSVESLRAIPWIFAWTQNRLMLPAWLGAGKALQQAIDNGYHKSLEEMYQNWPFFSTRIGMLEMVFAKADLWLAEYYDRRLVDKNLWVLGRALRGQLSEDIRTVLSISNDSRLMEDQPWIAESILLRNIYTDSLNILQAELLYRSRLRKSSNLEEGPPDSRIEQALMITIAGIAAGMRNTG